MEFIDFRALGWEDQDREDKDDGLENKILDPVEYEKLIEVLREKGATTEIATKAIRLFEVARATNITLKLLMDDLVEIKDLNGGNPTFKVPGGDDAPDFDFFAN